MAADSSAPTLAAWFRRPSPAAVFGLLFVAAIVLWLVVNPEGAGSSRA